MKLSYKPNLQAATTIVEVVAAVTILAISAAGLKSERQIRERVTCACMSSSLG